MELDASGEVEGARQRSEAIPKHDERTSGNGHLSICSAAVQQTHGGGEMGTGKNRHIQYQWKWKWTRRILMDQNQSHGIAERIHERRRRQRIHRHNPEYDSEFKR